MKRLSKNEFELRDDAVRMLELVQSEFGGIRQRGRNSNTIWTVIDCNGFETVTLSYDEQSEIHSLDVTNCFWSKGEEIVKFIEENRKYVL